MIHASEIVKIIQPFKNGTKIILLYFQSNISVLLCEKIPGYITFKIRSVSVSTWKSCIFAKERCGDLGDLFCLHLHFTEWHGACFEGIF